MATTLRRSKVQRFSCAVPTSLRMLRDVAYLSKPAVARWAEHVRSAPVFQTSTCSAIAKASYISIISDRAFDLGGQPAPSPGDAHLDPSQEKRLQFAFALHINAAAWLQREGTDEVARDILGHMDSIG